MKVCVDTNFHLLVERLGHLFYELYNICLRYMIRINNDILTFLLRKHYSFGPRAARCPARCCALSSGKLTRAPVGLLASPTGKTQ